MQQPQARKATKLALFLSLVIILVLTGSLIFSSATDGPSASEKLARQEELLQSVLKEAPSRGALQDASIVILEFGDFACPGCKTVAPYIQQAINEHPSQIRHVWVHTVNPDHEQSRPAAVAGRCAQRQGAFWQYHDSLFAEQDNLSTEMFNRIARTLNLEIDQFQSCLQDESVIDLIARNRQLAEQNDVNQTPYLIINDTVLEGSFSREEFQNTINRLLSQS